MGLRERKKQRTAQSIEDAALDLFEERGFQATTIADIAEAVEIAPRTFFSYFPTKESVLFGDVDPALVRLEEHLAARGDDSLLDALRAWILAEVDSTGLPDERGLRQRVVIDASDELLAYERQVLARFETVIAAAAATDLGSDPRDLQPRLIGAAAAATLSVLRPDPNAPNAIRTDPFGALDDALAFLRAGMAALRDRRI